MTSGGRGRKSRERRPQRNRRTRWKSTIPRETSKTDRRTREHVHENRVYPRTVRVLCSRTSLHTVSNSLSRRRRPPVLNVRVRYERRRGAIDQQQRTQNRDRRTHSKHKQTRRYQQGHKTIGARGAANVTRPHCTGRRGAQLGDIPGEVH